MITPRTLQGFFDYLPPEMILRQFVRDTWREIFEKYGYGQLETPSIEHADILFGKYGEEEKLIYHFKDHGGRHVALRYDQTVPLARVAAQYLNGKINLPFKRYEISKVWRADAARKARKREFYQCDADILGSTSLLCESEILSLLHDGFNKLNLKNHIINLSHRGILKSFLESLNFDHNLISETYRAIDKLDKIGLNGVEDELKSRKIPAAKIPQILEFIDLSSRNNQDILKHIAARLKNLPAVEELRQLLSYLEAANIPAEKIKLNPGLVRGLDYYTGVVFEVSMPDFGSSSLAGGGRYDNLLHTFTKENVTGIGVGIGFEPICLALEELNLAPSKKTNTQVLITIFDQTLIPDYLKLAYELRDKNINTEVYPNQKAKIAKQLKYADHQKIPYTIVLGSDEKKNNLLILKNMQSGQQEKIEIGRFIKSPDTYMK